MVRGHQEEIWLASGIIVVLLAAWTVSAFRTVPLSDPVTWRVLLDGLGFWKDLGFLLVQTGQVVIPFLPGQATGVASGYLFGVWLGLWYSMVGSVVGSLIAYWLASRWGRDILYAWLDASSVERWDQRVDAYGVPVFFGMLLLPGFPDDVLCFAAGMSNMRLDWYLVSVILGRIPMFALYAYAGANPGMLLSVEGVLIATVLSAVSAVCFWYRELLFAWLTVVIGDD